MSSILRKLSVVCPAYQEEDVLPRFHAELASVLSRLESEYTIEVIYVDDGSRDGTLAGLRRLAASDRRVRYLSLSRNFGHQVALTAGLDHATGDVIVTLDSDLQHPPERVSALLEPLENNSADFAVGSRYVDGGSMEEQFGAGRRLLSQFAKLSFDVSQSLTRRWIVFFA